MEQREINEKISQGMIHLRSIIEVVGKPKEYVEDTLKEYVKKIKENKDFSLLKQDLEKPEEQEGFFSAFAEIELLVKDKNALLSFSFDYLPSSIEIMAPEHLAMNNNELSAFLNDLQTRLHALNTGIIQTKDLNRFYVKNTAVLLRNFITVLLSTKPMSIKNLTPFLGVKEEDIEKVLGVMLNEGKIKKDKDLFVLVK